LSGIPSSLLLLPKLQTLDLSHNLITRVDLTSPISPSPEAYDYGAGFLTTSFSRPKPKGQPPIWPELRTLNLGYNKIKNVGLSGMKDAKSLSNLRVLNLENNSLSGKLDLEYAGLGKESIPSLNELVLSGNKALQTTSGSLAPNAEIKMEGCNVSGLPLSSSDDEDASTQSKSTPKLKRTTDLPTPNPTTTIVYRTMPASTFDGLPLSIDFDIYLPPTPPKPSSSGHPLVIWFHGGGLLQGNKENLPPHFRRLPTHAYPSGESVAVISPNYRLAPQVPILDILSDITALLEFVRVKLNDKLEKGGFGGHKIDTERICLSGGSAGGYLALIAGLAVPKESNLEALGGYRGELGTTTGIKCLAPFYPITDLTDRFWATKTDPVPWFGRR
jgi:acetyl esterase/lipase